MYVALHGSLMHGDNTLGRGGCPSLANRELIIWGNACPLPLARAVVVLWLKDQERPVQEEEVGR